MGHSIRLPPISFPSFDADLIREILVDALTIALVSYAISVSVAKAFAKKHGDKIEVNQVYYNKDTTLSINLVFFWTIRSISIVNPDCPDSNSQKNVV